MNVDKNNLNEPISDENSPPLSPHDSVPNDLLHLRSCIDALYEKYKNDPHVLSKLIHHVTSTLPATLHAHQQAKVDRIQSKKQEENTKMHLKQQFIMMTNYYFSSVTETFFTYQDRVSPDMSHFSPVSHDHISEHIHRMLSDANINASLKYKVTRLILKDIKEKSILSAIPSSNTIQRIIQLFTLDEILSKNSIKYFLTIVGDCILKKNGNLCYFLSTRMKPFMRELSNRCYEYLGCDSMLRRFKYKFSHEYHSMTDCRLLMKMRFPTEHLNLFKSYALDLICVATHYSSRYGSGDEFLQQKSIDNELVVYTNYLRNMASVDSIVDDFANTSLVTTSSTIPSVLDNNGDNNINKDEHQRQCDDFFFDNPYETISTNHYEEAYGDATLSWKNMMFIWKRFCEHNSIPSVVYLQQLKTHLMQRYEYSEDSDCFRNVTSPHAPIVKLFLKFWSECAILTNNEDTACENGTSTSQNPHYPLLCGTIPSLSTSPPKPFFTNHHTPETTDAMYIDHDTEYEIEEVCGMFRAWNQNQTHLSVSNTLQSNHRPLSMDGMSESLVLKLIKHYFEDYVTVEDDKYIYGVYFPMWNKSQEVLTAVRFISSCKMSKIHSLSSLSKRNHDETLESTTEPLSTCTNASDNFENIPSTVSTLNDVYSLYQDWKKKHSSHEYTNGLVSTQYFNKILKEKFFGALIEKENPDGQVLALDWSLIM